MSSYDIKTLTPIITLNTLLRMMVYINREPLIVSIYSLRGRYTLRAHTQEEVIYTHK